MLNVLCAAIVTAGLVAAAVELYVLIDLRSFEFEYLLEMLGAKGWLYILVLEAGGVVLCWWAWRVIRGRAPSARSGRIAASVLAIWLALAAWLLDWVLIETPVTFHLQQAIMSEEAHRAAEREALQYAQRSGDLAALAGVGASRDERALSIMIARVVVNRPHVFESARLGETLVKYAAKYDVDPTLTLAWAYLDSYYGEATSGPMPMFRELTAEGFRDLVQTHLPAWFVESRIRRLLIEGDWLTRAFGDGLGTKLRYALQKANYDVSSDPFDTSIFSDLFLVLLQFEGEFPELSVGADTNALDSALRDSFAMLRDVTLLEPYDQPYVHEARDAGFYTQHREAMITFGRAAFYKLQTDFEFATKIQTLLAKYYMDQYRTELGESNWGRFPPYQRAALVAMLRDLYMPNIGRPSYNVYLLPELNCTPFRFVVSEARDEVEEISSSRVIWRPRGADRLWAGATYKIASFVEVWRAATGEVLAGPPPTDTVSAAARVIARNVSRLGDDARAE